MINLPTKMLKELAEEGSPLPEAVIINNLMEIATKEGTLEITDEEVVEKVMEKIRKIKGMIIIKGEELK